MRIKQDMKSNMTGFNIIQVKKMVMKVTLAVGAAAEVWAGRRVALGRVNGETRHKEGW